MINFNLALYPHNYSQETQIVGTKVRNFCVLFSKRNAMARFFVIHIVILLISYLAFLLHNNLGHRLEKRLIQQLLDICD